MRFQDLPKLLKESAYEWLEDGATRLSAALAYYSIFSLAPLLVILVSVAGLIYGPQAARGEVENQIAGLVGREAGTAIQSAVSFTGQSAYKGILGTLVGVGVLLFGASTVFGELKSALNLVWGVVVKPERPYLTLVRDRLLSFSVVLCVGFLLLVSLVISATLAAINTYMSDRLALPAAVWQVADLAVSFCVVTGLFTAIFKILPNVVLAWRDVWIGAAVTAILFTLGKFAIGWYLGTSGVASGFGAAGSVVLILVWIYYAACILFFGAEITKVYVRQSGRAIRPDNRAMLATDVLRDRLQLDAKRAIQSGPAR